MKMPTDMRALRAQALKAAILNFMDFADQAIPDDDACMCGDRQDNHTFDSGHAFTPATQYHVMTLRKEVEKYLDVLETDEATTVTHTDLQGNESQVAVFGPSSFPMWPCPNSSVKTIEHPDIPDECAASGQSCSYAPEGPKGEMQCKYCGKPMAHVLWKKGEPGIPEQILDSNGDVVLACCKICGDYEQGLLDNPVCPGKKASDNG
ncbi:hypothetical protein [Enterobacter hormaechei]|uniref:hypothetical protein n=1 Tax=Enterobacter hormaechei TaxID=158836 RepID=UPI003D36D8C8